MMIDYSGASADCRYANKPRICAGISNASAKIDDEDDDLDDDDDEDDVVVGLLTESKSTFGFVNAARDRMPSDALIFDRLRH